MDQYQAMRRIAFTPMPFPYAQAVKILTLLYVFLSPLAYCTVLKWWTPLGAFLMGVFVFGIEEIGVELEDPFGKDANDIDMIKTIRALDKDCSIVVALANKDYHPKDEQQISYQVDTPLLNTL